MACDKAEAICREHNVQITPQPFPKMFRFAAGTNPHATGRHRGVTERARAFWDGMQRPAAVLDPLPIKPRTIAPGMGFNGIVHFQIFTDVSPQRVTLISAELLPVSPESVLAKLSNWIEQQSWQLSGLTVGRLTEEEAGLLQAVQLSESHPGAATVSRAYRELSPTLRAGEMVLRYHLEAKP